MTPCESWRWFGGIRARPARCRTLHVGLRLPLIGRNPVGLAKHAHHEIDQVAAEDVHAAAAKLAEPLTVGERLLPAHHGVDFEELPEPTCGERRQAELDRRIVAIHVGQLHGQPLPSRLVEQF